MLLYGVHAWAIEEDDRSGAGGAPVSWRDLLVEHDYAQGCPLAATVIDASDNDELRTHVSELLARWQASVADVLMKFGAPRSAAGDRATVLLAAIEGALVLARARRSTQPLDAVEQHFKTTSPESRNGSASDNAEPTA